MKMNRIYRNAMAVLALAVGAMTTACSDWDDHYGVSNTGVVGNANGYLWENIKSNEQLSMFANLLEKVGYDSILSTSQSFTVWAPTNDVLAADYDRLNNLSESELLREFVKNHIARNLYAATGNIGTQKVLMLNKKVVTFSGSGSYTMGDANVVNANIPNYNGIMHTVDKEITFNYNIYETIDSTKYPLDSLHGYFAKYNVRQFLPGSSVEGSVVDGQITYVDSVFLENNLLFYDYNALINREDSSYTMIAPTDRAWRSTYERISKYFNYVSGYQFIDRSDTPVDTAVTFDAGYLKDSLIKQSIMSSLFFNNNIRTNRNLLTLEPGQNFPATDSLQSTLGHKYYASDATELFSEGIKLERSNGNFWLVDSLHLFPWRTYVPIIKIEAESGYTVIPEQYRSSAFSVYETTKNPNVPGRVSNYRYLSVYSESQSNPSFHMYLPNVLSTTYVIFGVFVPANITDTAFQGEILPNRARMRIYYNRANGTKAPTPRNGSYFTTNPEKVDTVNMGEFEFPIAYRGTSSGQSMYYPSLTIEGNARNNKNYHEDYVLRMDCVILVPKEMIEYLQQHPEYLKYYPEYKNFL